MINILSFVGRHVNDITVGFLPSNNYMLMFNLAIDANSIRHPSNQSTSCPSIFILFDWASDIKITII